MQPQNPSAYSLSELLEIMTRLRAPDGCPWDRKQTHHSLLNYLIEESYEFIDAVENGDRANMKEELGDVLLQVVFHAQLAKETGDFDFAQVVHGISEKLVRRHPHVFGELKLDGAEAVEVKWDELKKAEKAAQGAGAQGAGAQGAGAQGNVPASCRNGPANPASTGPTTKGRWRKSGKNWRNSARKRRPPEVNPIRIGWKANSAICSSPP
jgi:NTP pyrophosphatase (non-canonical NTP hydrolase)